MKKNIITGKDKGFTLVEIMIVVSIIALLAAIGLPNLLRARQQAEISRIAGDLKSFSTSFQMYYLDRDQWPVDSHVGLPAGMDVYITLSVWSKSVWGGNYNWEGPESYPYAGISLFSTTATTQELTSLDTAIDDGNLATGKFRLTANARYTYIISE